MELTASNLLALAHGFTVGGDRRCFFCGAFCGADFGSDTFVKDTFNDWGIVAFPASKFVCQGCVLALDERIAMPGKDKPQKFRNYSWLLAGGISSPLTKADLALLRETCLDPPEPPWALALAVSGQRHLLYRTPVNFSRESCAVQLEQDRIDFAPVALRERLDLCSRIAAATGKPALSATWTAGTHFALDDYWTDDADDIARQWESVRGEPLSALAIFLAQKKEDAIHDYPSPIAAI